MRKAYSVILWSLALAFPPGSLGICQSVEGLCAHHIHISHVLRLQGDGLAVFVWRHTSIAAAWVGLIEGEIWKEVKLVGCQGLLWIRPSQAVKDMLDFRKLRHSVQWWCVLMSEV